MPIKDRRLFVASSEHFMVDVARSLVLFAFIGIWGWTVRSIIRIWLPYMRKGRQN
jgi:hypothetical protein